MAELCAGIARARLGPAAAIIDPSRGVAACEENRLTRAREGPTTGPPELAMAELLTYFGRSEDDLRCIGLVDDAGAHCAHAEYAFRSSGFDEAIVVVCNASSKGWNAVRYAGAARRNGPLSTCQIDDDIGEFPIARIYSTLTAALGFRPGRDEHLVEALARAGAARESTVADRLVLNDEGLAMAPGFCQAITDEMGRARDREKARRDIAAAVQQQLCEALILLLNRMAGLEPGPANVGLCLSGGLFFNTSFTTIAAQAGGFDRTFVPPHPGRNGSAIGAALLVSPPERFGAASRNGIDSAYLGPQFTDEQVKEALDNCKLSYELLREEQVIGSVLRALSRGRLVGWFDGRLEWGPRALGHRSVLADPFATHVLDNLNGYLKRRPSYRGYGVSVPASRLTDLFEPAADRGRDETPFASRKVRGVEPSPFMQYEYQPRDLEKFRTILPPGVKTLRVHTVDQSEPRYLRLLEQWGEMSGLPVLVNTSFNGFHEPLVCSPRDAIRVFYGTGLDVLALEDFVLRK